MNLACEAIYKKQYIETICLTYIEKTQTQDTEIMSMFICIGYPKPNIREPACSLAHQ